jgi:8-oxo-dGTP diphosphatase
MKKHWVVGFLFNSKTELALVMKTHPDWQAGKLNGVGGKVEDGESILEAMRREFKEEAGAQVDDWREFAVLNIDLGEVRFLVAHGDHELQSLTEEQVAWYSLDDLKTLPHLKNLDWLIPLALDVQAQMTEIEYTEIR